MTALITALSTAAQTLLYAALAFGCGVVGLATCAALMGHARDSLGDDALGEVGEGDRAAGHLVQRNKSKTEF